jgi:hypothetical protein
MAEDGWLKAHLRGMRILVASALDVPELRPSR